MQSRRSTLTNNDFGLGNLLLHHLGFCQLLLVCFVLATGGLLEAERRELVAARVSTSVIEVVDDLSVVILCTKLQLFWVLVHSTDVFSSVRFTVDLGTFESCFQVWFRMICTIGRSGASDLITSRLDLISQELVDLGLISRCTTCRNLNLWRLLLMCILRRICRICIILILRIHFLVLILKNFESLPRVLGLLLQLEKQG